MNYGELVTLAQSVGLSEKRARVAAAIAMAESGGNPNAHNAVPPDNSYGLWQINMLGSMGPDRRRRYGLPSNEALFDPRRNAMVMADISKQGGNFSAWTTYTSGKYLKYVDDKSILGALDPRNVGEAIGGGVSNAVDNLAEIRQAVTKSAAWLSNSDNWVRIAYVLGGGLVVLVAVGALLKGTTAGRTAAAVPKRMISSTRKTSRKGAPDAS